MKDRKHKHYFKDVHHLSHIDVYRVLELFNVTDPCVSHAVKKLLVSGGRGQKNEGDDIQEAIDSLVRWQEMRDEEFESDDIEANCVNEFNKVTTDDGFVGFKLQVVSRDSDGVSIKNFKTCESYADLQRFLKQKWNFKLFKNHVRDIENVDETNIKDSIWVQRVSI